MPRRARLEIPGVPLHVIQRGVNRCAIFLDDRDRGHYLKLLSETARRYEVALHAYVLMGNHVHMLVSAHQSGAISQAMRRLGQCFTQAFNRRHARTGPLWEGRFKSCLVDSETYLLSVYRYIELNPVRAGLVEAPQHYRWSSIHGNLGLLLDPLLTPHAVYQSLGRSRAERGAAYREFLMQDIPSVEFEQITAHLAQECALGGARFQAIVEKSLGRHAAWRRPGRPCKKD